MTVSAFVLGGTGLIGNALVPALLEAGYEVTVGSRRPVEIPTGAAHVVIDRSRDESFIEGTRGDHDLFVDVVAYTERDARQLTGLQGSVGSMVVISSAAVYADENGSMLLGSDRDAGAGIDESRQVVAAVPDGSDYAGGKVAVERTVLDSDLTVTILRPGAIFGPKDRASREWHFVKRALDKRRTILLARGGESVFHQVSARNVASMVALAAARPGTRILNCGDPEPRNVRQICETVADVMGHEWDTVVFPDPPRGTVGDTPWSTPHAFVLDLDAARADLGFSGGASYESAVAETCGWLISATRGKDWHEVLPAAARHYGGLFDYEAEDRFLDELHRL